jgi:SAM-dependent methyltransferase
MPSTISKMADAPLCPLCRAANPLAEPSIAMAEIERYWRDFSYDLAAEFGPLPTELRAWRCRDCALLWHEPRMIGGPALYAALARWPAYYRQDAWEWQVAIDILKAAGVTSLVEIGAGTGIFLRRAASFFPSLLGLEFNPDAVASAQTAGLPIEDRRLAALETPAETIVAFQVLEHLGDPAKFIAECRDKLAPRGWLVLAVPNDDGAAGRLHGDFLNLPPHHATRWRRLTLEKLASIFGLELVAYRVQPLDRRLHRLYRMRRLRPAASLAGKMLNRLRRLAIALGTPLVFAADRERIGGESHLAIYRKV